MYGKNVWKKGVFTLSGNSIIYLEQTETNQMVVVQRSNLSGQTISCLPSYSNFQGDRPLAVLQRSARGLKIGE